MVRPFLPWQAAAFTFANAAIARWGGCSVGDDMGMGKTQVLLALVCRGHAATGRLRHHGAPPVAEGGYQDDLQARFPQLRLAIVQGPQAQARRSPTADIYFDQRRQPDDEDWLTDVATRGQQGQAHHVASTWPRRRHHHPRRDPP